MITRPEFELIIDQIEAILLAAGYRWINDEQDGNDDHWIFAEFEANPNHLIIWPCIAQALSMIADDHDLHIDCQTMIADGLGHISIIASRFDSIPMPADDDRGDRGDDICDGELRFGQ